MFDLGMWEVILILVIALVVIGPERLPEVARVAGHWIGRARRYIEGVKGEVEKEFDTAELKRLLHNQEVQLRELRDRFSNPEGFIKQQLSDTTENKIQPPENKIETPSERQYEIIEEDHPTSPANMHANDHLKKPAENVSESDEPAPEKNKPI